MDVSHGDLMVRHQILPITYISCPTGTTITSVSGQKAASQTNQRRKHSNSHRYLLRHTTISKLTIDISSPNQSSQ